MTGPAMVRLPMTTKTISETTASVVEGPITASADPTPVARRRFLGFTPARSRPNPSAFPGADASRHGHRPAGSSRSVSP